MTLGRLVTRWAVRVVLGYTIGSVLLVAAFAPFAPGGWSQVGDPVMALAMTCVMVSATPRGLDLLGYAGLSAAIGALVGCVTLRDRRAWPQAPSASTAPGRPLP
ncbi:hypothetical protein [Xylanimonas ulmi]|uniref:Uncharacterized protein n=1 Tax=Xylanimonas ulmi TaxID=228973 RepID=A0A4Q7M0J1_9MICO|nr:hypothetical protein [Xylanibacterium ulmi]RZS60393.1 hypothetical protein EV386_0648 [Xylanibacterium ulmi]